MDLQSGEGDPVLNIWHEISLLVRAVSKHIHAVKRFYSQGKQMKKCSYSYSFGIVAQQNFLCHFELHLKRKFQHVGHIQIAL